MPPEQLLDALHRAQQRMTSLLHQLRPDHERLPTPCGDWTVRDLAEHVAGVAHAFAAVAGGEPAPAPARIPEGRSPVHVYEAACPAVLADLRGHRDLEASVYDSILELDGVVIPPIPLPGTIMASILLLDTGVHLHDLARAIDRPDLADDQDLAAATLEAARVVLQPGIREYVGFGPERGAPAGASPVEALLAFTGR